MTTLSDNDARTQRLAIARVYLAGVAAGMSLGRFVPLETGVRADFHLSLTAFGWLVSTITALAAGVAFPAARLISGRDPRRILANGLGIMCAASVVESASPVPVTLYVARVIEGAGYLLVVVTGPVTLAAWCSPVRYRRAIALWSTFIPVGLALSALAGLAASAAGWRLAAITTTVPAAASWAAALAWLREPGEVTPLQPGWRGVHVPLVLLSLAFSLTALVTVAVVAYLPGLMAARGVNHAVAGSLTAVTSLASAPGAVLAGWLMARTDQPAPLAAAALLMPAAGIAVFVANISWVAIAGAGVLMAANGFSLAVMYAMTATLARSRAELPRAYSLLVQAGSLGTLLGPPLYGYAVARSGWSSGSILTAVVTATGMVMYLMALRVDGVRR